MPKQTLIEHIKNRLSDIYRINIKTSSTEPISGGCINESIRLNINNTAYFLKWNDAKKYPGMFETEALGLKLLKSTGSIGVPSVIEQSELNDTSYLLLEFVDAGQELKNYYETFGAALARMHKCSADLFGLEYDNYIGSLNQFNKQTENGVVFFVEQRLKKQLAQAQEKGLLPLALKRKFTALFERLDDIFPDEKPALLHGDLWSGNYITGKDGAAWLVDPAIYYGYREADIAMTRLFGGFNSAFYSAYNNESPMEPGWEKRLDYYNLYPLLVHVNLFGSTYLNQIQNILSKF